MRLTRRVTGPKKRAGALIIDMDKLMKQNIQDILDYLDHCSGDAHFRRRGFWLLDEVYKSNPEYIKKAAVKCLKTLRRINKAQLDKETEFLLIDRVYELNYRILGRYLARRIKKDVLEDLQKINIFVQGIIWGDVKNLDHHYELNKDL